MPRPRKPGSGEPKTRSRHGCTQCKARKIKCGEQKPTCINCEKTGQTCDYSIKLNWDGRSKKGGNQNHMTASSISGTTQAAGESVLSFSTTTVNGNDSKEPKKPTTSSHMNNGRRSEMPSISTFESRPSFPRASRTSSTTSVSQFSRLKEDESPYPSPAESNIEESLLPNSKRASTSAFQAPLTSSDMPPPRQTSPRQLNAGINYADNGFKRTRLDAPMKSPDFPTPFHGYFHGSVNGRSSTSSTSAQMSPLNSSRVPPSPIASSAGSEESSNSRSRQLSHPDRRMSIESLISGESDKQGHHRTDSSSSTPKTYYGIDPGYPDFDTPYNNDKQALNDVTPSLNARPLFTGKESNKGRAPSDPTRQSLKPGPHKAFYRSAIHVKIPEEFEPLPEVLENNPMNLLYFHHFIHYTARILVPHDCSGNPFRKILPRMALKDNNLLRLVLAYSASHRARLMGYTEPRTRIAEYVDGLFETLLNALKDPNAQISNSTFATAVMLASLQIVSPNAFGFELQIPWTAHLNTARNIITARGIRQKMVDRDDDESYFLTRWFAYLDVLGSLSGMNKPLPLYKGDFWADDPNNPDEGSRIDCFYGFSDRCVSLLASIAELARICDDERSRHLALYPNDSEEWRPALQTVEAANGLRDALKNSLYREFQGCNHSSRPDSSPTPRSEDFALEVTTANDMYHYAGMIYLQRRVLRKPASDEQTQCYVDFIVGGLAKVSHNGTAEACLLFPIFVAGCEALQQSHRERLSERIRNIENTGLTQAKAAREVMERVWKGEGGGRWEALIDGEFIG